MQEQPCKKLTSSGKNRKVDGGGRGQGGGRGREGEEA